MTFVSQSVSETLVDFDFNLCTLRTLTFSITVYVDVCGKYMVGQSVSQSVWEHDEIVAGWR